MYFIIITFLHSSVTIDACWINFLLNFSWRNQQIGIYRNQAYIKTEALQFKKKIVSILPSYERCLLDLFSINFLMVKLVNRHLSQLGVDRSQNFENMLKPKYTKSFKIILLLLTSQGSCFLAFVLIKFLTENQERDNYRK